MEELGKRIIAGDEKAFEALVTQMTPQLYRTARVILESDEDAADALQEALLAAWEHRAQCKKPQYFRTWLMRILVNESRDMLKKRQFSCTEKIEAAKGETENAYTSLEWMECLKTLEEKYRLILLLYYVEGYSTVEIGNLLHMPVTTVRVRLSRGRKALRKVLEQGR